MYATVESYLKRITTVLDQTIAPAIESDQARGQVYAVINLLEQLATRVEIKQELIDKEIEMGVKVLMETAKALQQAGVEIEGDRDGFLAELESKGPGKDLAYCARLDETISAMIDLFFDRRAKLKTEDAAAIDQTIRDYLTKLATRDIGLTKPPNFDKISRSKREKEI